ncbi:MAG: amidohydrolase [Acidobacteriota bacterium]
MQIIDTHQHLWDLNQFSYSWCQTVPALNRSFRVPDYLEAAKSLGIEKTVHLEADVDEPFMLEETRHILSLADADDTPLEGVVACGRPEKTGFRNYLNQIAGHPKLKGIRRILHTQPDELSQTGLFLENIGALKDYRLSFDVCVLARQLPIARSWIEKCPEVDFILDHCGNPPIQSGDLRAWREDLATLAELPNVVCKVSGIVTNADPVRWSSEDLRPCVDHVIECFGWDRVLFGSDWPVCTLAASLRSWVEALQQLVEHAEAGNRHKLFYENAQRVYRLNSGSS